MKVAMHEETEDYARMAEILQKRKMKNIFRIPRIFQFSEIPFGFLCKLPPQYRRTTAATLPRIWA